VQTALANWMDFDGYAVAHGMPELAELPLPRFEAFIWHLLVRNADEKGAAKVKSQLWMPPKGTAPDPRSPWAPENEQKAFGALAASLGMKTGTGYSGTSGP
jgi:hypothetical protein